MPTKIRVTDPRNYFIGKIILLPAKPKVSFGRIKTLFLKIKTLFLNIAVLSQRIVVLVGKVIGSIWKSQNPIS